MRNGILILCAALLPFSVIATAAEPETAPVPVVKISASLVSSDGKPRVFWGRNGRTTWSPSLPVYQGDILTVAYSVENGPQPQRVWVKLDDRSLADLRKAPWRVSIDTSRLAPGRHVVNSDVRLGDARGMYSIAEYVFYVHAPRSEVKGIVEEFGSPNAAPSTTELLTPTVSFRGPSGATVDESFEVTVRSLDPDADRAIKEGRPVEVSREITLYLEARLGLDRWAYTITRNGRQIAGAGPMRRLVYLDVAPRSDAEPGLLPGEVTVHVWGVRSNGIYSRQVDVPLVVGKSE